MPDPLDADPRAPLDAEVVPDAPAEYPPSPSGPNLTGLAPPHLAGNLPLRPRRPRVWPVFIALLLALVVGSFLQLLVLLPFIVSALGRVEPDDLGPELMKMLESPLTLMLATAPLQLAIAASALAPAWLSPQTLTERLGLKRPRTPWWTLPIILLSTIPPTMLGIVFATALSMVVEPDTTLEALYNNMTPAVAVLFVMFIALAPGFSEEVFFRGYMQRRFIERYGPFHAILTSSLIFAFVHMAPHTVVFALPIGLWLGVIAWKTDSIVPTILCHAAINGVWNIWMIGSNYARLNGSPWPLTLAVLLVGLVFFAWTWRLLFQPPPAASEDKIESGPESSNEFTG